MPANSQSAVIAEGLTKDFPGVRQVDHLSVEVHAGEIFGLVGPDGAGKTTTLRMLAGVMPPDEGSVVVAGSDVIRDPEGTKHHLSYMPQRFGLYEDLTARPSHRCWCSVTLRHSRSITCQPPCSTWIAARKVANSSPDSPQALISTF